MHETLGKISGTLPSLATREQLKEQEILMRRLFAEQEQLLRDELDRRFPETKHQP